MYNIRTSTLAAATSTTDTTVTTTTAATPTIDPKAHNYYYSLLQVLPEAR